MERKLSETVEVDLIDLCWKGFSAWKLVIPFALIVGLLVSGLKYYRDINVSEAENDDSVTAETFESNLTEDEIRSVYDYLTMKKDLIGQNYYITHSPLMQLDPYHVNKLKLSYEVLCESELHALNLKEMLKQNLRDSAGEILSSHLSEDYSTEYCDELFIFSDDTKRFNQGRYPSVSSVLSVEIILPEAINTNLIKLDIENRINDYIATLPDAETITVNYVTSSEIDTVDYDLLTYKFNINSYANSLRSYVKTGTDAFNDEQMNLYNYLLSENTMERDTSGAEELSDDELADMGPSSLAPAPHLSKKYFLFGMILGVFLYALILFLKEILRPTVSTESDLNVACGIRNFGGIYAYPMARSKFFTSSKALYTLRYKKLLDKEKQIEEAANKISTYLDKHSIDSATLVVSDALTDAERAVLDEILSASKTKLSIREETNSSYDISTLSNEKNIIPVLISNVTGFERIDNLFGICKDYDVQVLGSVYLG